MYHTGNLGDASSWPRPRTKPDRWAAGCLAPISIDILNGVGAKLLAISHYMDHDNALRKHQPVRLRKPDWLTMRV